jgi:hypothetical protein
MTVLGVIGDVLWIFALSLMAGASRMAWRKIPKGVAVPVLWSGSNTTLARAPRLWALATLPIVAFVLSLFLLAGAHAAAAWSVEAVLMFGVRATLAAIFALVHLSQVRRALNQLAEEGQIKL